VSLAVLVLVAHPQPRVGLEEVDPGGVDAAARERDTEGRLLLFLAGVRGTQDATSLVVSLRRPATHGREVSILGSAALFGLRRATPSGGLNFPFDLPDPFLPPGGVSVGVRPDPPLPPGADIRIDAIRLVRAR
jgi:hypothetical protein